MDIDKDVIRRNKGSLKAKVCVSYLGSALKPPVETHIKALHNGCIKQTRTIGILPWDLCKNCKSGNMCWREEFVKGNMTFEILLNMREWYCPNLLYIPLLDKLQVHHRTLKLVDVPDGHIPKKRQTVTPFETLFMDKEKRYTDETNEQRRLEFRVVFDTNKGLENWFSNPIVILKCFLPENCNDVRSLNDIQPCGLISGILNCDLFDEVFSFSLYDNDNLLSEIHSFAKEALLLSDLLPGYYSIWERNALPLFLTLLQDPKYFLENKYAQEVISKILKVMKDQVTDEEIGTVLGISSITEKNELTLHTKWGDNGDCSLIKFSKTWPEIIQNKLLHKLLNNIMATDDACLYCNADNVYLIVENSVQLKAAIDMSCLQLFSSEVGFEKEHSQVSHTHVNASTEDEHRRIHMQDSEEIYVRNEHDNPRSSNARGPQIWSAADQTLPSPVLQSMVSYDNIRSINRPSYQVRRYTETESDRSINRYTQPSRAVGVQESQQYNHQRNEIAEHDDRSYANHSHLTRNEDNTLQNIHTVNKEPIVVKKQPKYPAYVDENERFRSFSRWCHMIPSPTMLCKAGFFFTNTADLVRCYQCGIGLKDFSSTDDPLKEHVKHSSQCEHLLLYFETESALETYKKSMRDLEPGAIRQRQLAEFRERSLQGPPPRQYRIRNEAYNTYDLRLSSFVKWSEHIAQRPPRLAEAGLYYTGIDDHVRCFACDGGLRHWDPEDDPWIEHCRWFPACPFAREQKGDEFIALVQASADQNIDELGATGGNSTNDLAGGVNNLHITDPDIKRLIEEQRKICTVDMGFSNEMFSSAVNELRLQGTLKPSVEDIVIAIEVINDRNQHSTEIRGNGNKDTSPEELLQENKRLKDMLTCFICQNNPVNALFLPCTHHRLCLDCSYDLKECPVCLRAIKEKIKTFMG
ncbi:uncharacterized protein LOC128238207 isoform X2 [Mya arenaria]|uniref:uncharacterized protein LOC128238207 isoform X2 n=1 Tax=Mya arenaria TaxID=6604 RepID=UPI0022E78480|nr:uncharacterized protein LOC128238207 isoform X2 [Mya arenaria]